MRKVLLPWQLLLLVVLAWWLLPVQLGGRTAYVIVNGNSMYPTLHRGDLVLVRRAESYSPGQIAAYRYPDVGTVIHRVVGTAGDRLIFKGDHNSWTDGYRPTPAEVIGSYWLKIPKIGGLIGNMRSPLEFAILAMVIGAVSLGPAALGARRSASTATRVMPTVGSGLLVAAALSLLLGALAFTRPTRIEAVQEVPYTQSGRFGYTARANPSVYDGGVVTTGQPVFRRLVDALQLRLAYRFSSPQPHEVGGSYKVLAQVGDDSGWRRSIELVPSTPFRGDGFERSFQLDLRRVQQLLAEAQRLTGVQREQYTLTILAQITTGGTLDGQQFRAQFAPAMAFQMDSLRLQLLQPTEGEATGKSVQAMLRVPTLEANYLSLGPLRLPVIAARWLATLLLLGSILGLIALQGWSRRLLEQGEHVVIASRWGHALVDVLEPPSAEGIVPLRDLGSLEALLASAPSARLLHARQGDHHYYYVMADGQTYLYAAEGR